MKKIKQVSSAARSRQRGVHVLAMATAVVLSLVCGCGDNAGIGSEFSKGDPKTSFERFVKSYAENLQIVMREKEKADLALMEQQIRQNAPLGVVYASDRDIRAIAESIMAETTYNARIPKNRRGVFLYGFVTGSERYDVRKTDSLVTPYVGLLTYKETREYVRTYDRSIDGTVSRAGERNTPDQYERTLKFGYRDRKWEPMEISGGFVNSTEVFDREQGEWLWTAYERTRQ